MLSIIVFLLILSDTLPKSNQQPILSRMIMSLTFFSLFGVFFTVLISALNSYKNDKIDGKGKIDSKVVRFLYNLCKMCCVFKKNSCVNNPNDVESQKQTNNRETQETQQTTQDEIVTTITNLDDINYRSNSYRQATNTETNTLVRRGRSPISRVSNNIREVNNILVEKDSEVDKKEKEILQEECNKMISVLETVYSVTFLIIFITLCVIMFTSKF